ncbi:hypothetical protein TB1_013660 [Malus domestica]
MCAPYHLELGLFPATAHLDVAPAIVSTWSMIKKKPHTDGSNLKDNVRKMQIGVREEEGTEKNEMTVKQPENARPELQPHRWSNLFLFKALFIASNFQAQQQHHHTTIVEEEENNEKHGQRALNNPNRHGRNGGERGQGS